MFDLDYIDLDLVGNRSRILDLYHIKCFENFRGLTRSI